MRQHLLVTAAVVALAGCASSSKDIRSAYISPMTYESYSCQQLIQENQRLQQRISSVGGEVDRKASGDKMKMGVGLVLFWPTLFFLKGDGAEAQEYARLKGEHEAIENSYTRKNCGAVMAGTATEPMRAAAPVQIATGVQAAPVYIPEGGYQGTFFVAAKNEFGRMQCSDNFRFVSESAGRSFYEATCKGGKRQLLECRSGSCKPLN